MSHQQSTVEKKFKRTCIIVLIILSYNAIMHANMIFNNFSIRICSIHLLFSSAANGVYYLKSNESSEIYPVYCHMSSFSTKCLGGGWTLVMKLDRNKVRIVIVNSIKLSIHFDSLGIYYQWRNQHDNLVPLCKLSMIIIYLSTK